MGIVLEKRQSQFQLSHRTPPTRSCRLYYRSRVVPSWSVQSFRGILGTRRGSYAGLEGEEKIATKLIFIYVIIILMPPQPHNPYKIFVIIALSFLLLINLGFAAAIGYYAIAGEDDSLEYDDYGYEESDSGSCNVKGIALHGDLFTYLPQVGEYDAPIDGVSSEDFEYWITSANNDEEIKAILVEVDSYGGYPVAGEEIAQAIKSSSKPVVAYIRGAGTSAAYWAVTSADRIFASRNSDVGSIGVTMSYLDNVSYNESEGLSYVQLIAGKFKDAGSPDKTLTTEEKAMFERDLKIIHENFMQEVATNRNIPIEKIRTFADGSSFLGVKAQELGLIDGIGGYAEAVNYAKGLIGEDVEVCW